MEVVILLATAESATHLFYFHLPIWPIRAQHGGPGDDETSDPREVVLEATTRCTASCCWGGVRSRYKACCLPPPLFVFPLKPRSLLSPRFHHSDRRLIDCAVLRFCGRRVAPGRMELAAFKGPNRAARCRAKLPKHPPSFSSSSSSSSSSSRSEQLRKSKLSRAVSTSWVKLEELEQRT